jgi:hypothetical protein
VEVTKKGFDVYEASDFSRATSKKKTEMTLGSTLPALSDSRMGGSRVVSGGSPATFFTGRILRRVVEASTPAACTLQQ